MTDWISVENRLPADGQLVIIFIGEVGVARWRSKGRSWWSRLLDPPTENIRVRGNKITHWMPLPSPPSEDKHEEGRFYED